MIQQQLEIQLSPYAGLYDIVVPQDDIYRQLDRLVDFSFVYEEIGKNYSWKKGRFAEDPVRMFKYLLVKIIDRLSDRRTEPYFSRYPFFGLPTEVEDCDIIYHE
jgi:transposase